MNVRELVDRLKVEKKKPLSFLKETKEIELDSEVIYLDECSPEDYFEELDAALNDLGSLSITVMTEDFFVKTYHIYFWNRGRYDIIEECSTYN